MKTKSFAFVCLFLTGLFAIQVSAQTTTRGNTTTVVYDSFQKTGGYTLADYYSKWSNSFGLGEMAANDTRSFTGGKFFVGAAPFQTAFDFSVF